jgi:hypothetical protein
MVLKLIINGDLIKTIFDHILNVTHIELFIEML